MSPTPLQNRVQPDGAIVSVQQRGRFLGNRGGKIHQTASKTLLPKRRWATRQWICCVLDFKNRQRQVMGPGYTELFFLDEVTALAAGHRPCFECRRADALSFAQAFIKKFDQSALGDRKRESAPQMDKVLHQQRLSPDGKKRIHRRPWNDLPIGAMVEAGNIWIAKSPSGALQWSLNGYVQPNSKSGTDLDADVDCLTPPAILDALSNGYEPHWHPSAKMR